MRGVVAAGHPLTAEAGAAVLREGGNAVDAAVAAVLMSFVCESPLTGPGAGGFMLVHSVSGENQLLDFFVAAPGEGLAGAMAAGFLVILAPILTNTPEGAAIYAPEGRLLKAGERITMLELGDFLERLGAEGPAFAYTGDVAKAVSAWVLERGGLLTEADLAAYAPVDREPVWAGYRGRDVLTNPPPSSGGILIAYSLDLLERLGRPCDVRTLVEVMDRTNKERTDEFVHGLQSEGYLERFLHKEVLESAASELGSRLGSRLGSTTPHAVRDADGG